jgi:hypothetical protein
VAGTHRNIELNIEIEQKSEKARYYRLFCAMRGIDRISVGPTIEMHWPTQGSNARGQVAAGTSPMQSVTPRAHAAFFGSKSGKLVDLA